MHAAHDQPPSATHSNRFMCRTLSESLPDHLTAALCRRSLSLNGTVAKPSATPKALPGRDVARDHQNIDRERATGVGSGGFRYQRYLDNAATAAGTSGRALMKPANGSPTSCTRPGMVSIVKRVGSSATWSSFQSIGAETVAPG